MTPSTPAPELDYVAALPATLSGLWAAMTLTHDFANRLCDHPDPRSTGQAAAITEACAQATECLATCRQEVFADDPDRPWRRDLGLLDGLALTDALAGSCIALAVEVLGNEDEPLNSVEVLAVTRCVTALCTARTLAQAGAA